MSDITEILDRLYSDSSKVEHSHEKMQQVYDQSLDKEVRLGRQLDASEKLIAVAGDLSAARDYEVLDLVTWKSPELTTHKLPILGQPALVLEIRDEAPKHVKTTNSEISSYYHALNCNVKVLVETPDGSYGEFWLPGDRFCKIDLKRLMEEFESTS